jgi:hypothetical protein
MAAMSLKFIERALAHLRAGSIAPEVHTIDLRVGGDGDAGAGGHQRGVVSRPTGMGRGGFAQAGRGR